MTTRAPFTEASEELKTAYHAAEALFDYNDLSGAEAAFREHIDALDFVLVDGCHERECVKIDFEGAAKRIPAGGIVAFHDSDEVAQGVHPQPHTGEPIGVRSALFDLGLLPGGTKDWKLLADIEANPGSHGVAIFQKRG